MELMHLLITALILKTSISVNYNDLERMGVACSPRDTCRRSSNEFLKRNCECDRTCLSYDDCCVDGPKPTRGNRPKKVEGITCIEVLPNEGFYGVSTCPSSWNGPSDVRDKCQRGDRLQDPLMSTPVTDTRSQRTYGSVYCATCNNANPDSLSIWNIDVICNSLSPVQSLYQNVTQEFIMENIVRVGDSWGVYHWDISGGGTSFFPCALRYSVPQSVTNQVRYCRPNMVSTCTPDWNDQSARKNCDSYMAAIYINGQTYRNAHCAFCNRVSLDNAKCVPGGEDIVEGLSFVLLLDLKKEQRSRCPSQQVYDNFAKKCRRLICRLPGHVLRNGECVKN